MISTNFMVNFFHFTLCEVVPNTECLYFSNKVFNCYSICPTDRNLDADTFPKPTIFFPSIAEIKFHKVGTYLCLLENFFPEVIKIDWQEKDGKRILTSRQGDTVKTNDTYMKFSWLTVTKKSIAKEHKCIVTHTSNKGGVNEEILFRSMKKGMCV